MAPSSTDRRPQAAHRRNRTRVVELDTEDAIGDKRHIVIRSISKLLHSCSCTKKTYVVPIRSKCQPLKSDLEDDALSISDRDGGVSLSDASSISWSGSEYELDCVTTRVPVTMPVVLPGAVASDTDLLNYDMHSSVVKQVNYVKKYHTRHRKQTTGTKHRPAKRLGELPPLEIQGNQPRPILPPINKAEDTGKAYQSCEKAAKRRCLKHRNAVSSEQKSSKKSSCSSNASKPPAPMSAVDSAKRQEADGGRHSQGEAVGSESAATPYKLVIEGTSVRKDMVDKEGNKSSALAKPVFTSTEEVGLAEHKTKIDSLRNTLRKPIRVTPLAAQSSIKKAAYTQSHYANLGVNMQTEDAYKVGMTLTEQICSAEERLTKLSHALEDRWEKKELIDYMQQKRQAIKFNHLSVRTTVQKTKSTGPRSIAADLTRFSIAQRQAVNNNDARPSNGVKRSNSTKTSSELDIDYITGLRPRSRYSEEEMRKRIPTTTCTMHSYIKPLPAQCGSVRKFTNRSPHHHNLSYHQQCETSQTKRPHFIQM